MEDPHIGLEPGRDQRRHIEPKATEPGADPIAFLDAS
jgi:hypothetical protein